MPDRLGGGRVGAFPAGPGPAGSPPPATAGTTQPAGVQDLSLPGLAPGARTRSGRGARLSHVPGGLRDRQRQVAQRPRRPGLRPPRPGPATRRRSSVTDSPRSSTSTSTGTATSSQPLAREVISTCPAPPGSHSATSSGFSALSKTSSHRSRAGQLPQHRLAHRSVVGPRPRRSASAVGQGRELPADQLRLLGRDPPHDVVPGRVPVGVLDRQLGLADPAHPRSACTTARRPRSPAPPAPRPAALRPVNTGFLARHVSPHPPRRRWLRLPGTRKVNDDHLVLPGGVHVPFERLCPAVPAGHGRARPLPPSAAGAIRRAAGSYGPPGRGRRS